MKHRPLIAFFVLLSLAGLHSRIASLACAQEGVKNLAKLGEQFITANDVDFQLGRVANESVEPMAELPPAVLQSTIYLIAQQRQALQTLRTQNLAVRRDDVERWLDENGQPQDGSRLTADEMLRQQSQRTGISEVDLRDHLAFRLSWQRYLQKQLNEKNVAKHFENQTERFDGTRFQVSIVDLAATAGSSAKREQSTAKLNALRAQLESSALSWKELASKLQESEESAAASRFRVREKVWVRGTGDLEPTIITSVMKLEPNGVSEPIHTPTGVHLFQLHEVELGTKRLPEVRDEVRAHMLIHLLEHLARQSESQLPLQAIE